MLLIQWFFVVNPCAGGGKALTLWPLIAEALKKERVNFEFAYTASSSHAAELVRKAVAEGHRYVAAVGGDGTAHDCIQGIMTQGLVPPNKITLTVIPVGTGNDWIKTWGLKGGWQKAVQRLKRERIAVQEVAKVVLFEANGNQKVAYSHNVIGLCMDAFVVKYSQPKTKPSWLPSVIYYYVVSLKCLFAFKTPKLKVRMDDDARIVEGAFLNLNVGVCKYSAGGAIFCPQAIATDGLLALTLMGDFSRWEAIRNSSMYYTGKILEYKKVHGYQARKIRIEPLEAGGELPEIELDGEYLGRGLVEIEVLPKVLNIWI